jgi:small subunit ribosomal protein S27Ae
MEKKKQKKPKKQNKRYLLYDISAGLKRKNKFCPRCGSGIFMAQHKDRVTCGKCRYTDFITKKSEQNKV